MALKILIIGANGYLGKNIYESFSNTLNYHLYYYKRATNTISDAADNALSRRSIPFFDIVFYLAAADQKACDYDASHAIKSNVDTPLNIVSKHLRGRIGRLIYFSTIQVYGDNLKGNINYETPTQPKNNYANTKLKAEYELTKLSREQNFTITVLRLGNCFGYYQKTFDEGKDLALNAFCIAAARDGVIKIKGNCQNQKAFLPMNALLKILHNMAEEHKTLQSKYICGAKRSTSILSAAAYIQRSFQKIAGKKITLTYETFSSHNTEFTLPRLPGFDECPLPDQITPDMLEQELIRFYA